MKQLISTFIIGAAMTGIAAYSEAQTLTASNVSIEINVRFIPVFSFL